MGDQVLKATAAALAGALALLAGCPGPVQVPPELHPAMVVKRGDLPVQPAELIDINPTTLGIDKDLDFLIENVGDADLWLRRSPPVTLIGGDLSMFSVSEQPSSWIGPGETSSFTIRFTPTDMRNRSIGVSIGSNEPQRSSFDFTVTRYTEAEISLKAGAVYIPSGAAYDIGSVQLPSCKLASFLIQNVGTGELDLTGNPTVSIGGADAGQFSIFSQPATPVAPGSSSEFTLAFIPSSYGPKNAVVSIENSDADEGTYSFSLGGLATLGDVRVSDGSRESDHPAAVWTGTEYGVVWQDARDENFEIYFTRLNSSVQKLMWDVRITSNPALSGFPSIVWTGTEFGVAWEDNRDGNSEIYFARISTAGLKLGEEVRITASEGSSGSPSLAWNGTEFGLAWSDDRTGVSEIYFARINSSGVKQGEDVRVTETAQYSGLPSLAWTGTEYGVAWMDGPYSGGSYIYFARLSPEGVKQGTDVQLTNGSRSISGPSLAWAGTEYGLAWSEGAYQQQEIYFARVSSSGVKQGASLSLTSNSWDSRDPSLVWTGSQYGLAWEDGRGVYTYRDIYFARVTSAGGRDGSNVRVTMGEMSWVPSLAWAGAEYGVLWRDSRSSEIYFALLDSNGVKQ